MHHPSPITAPSLHLRVSLVYPLLNFTRHNCEGDIDLFRRRTTQIKPLATTRFCKPDTVIPASVNFLFETIKDSRPASAHVYLTNLAEACVACPRVLYRS